MSKASEFILSDRHEYWSAASVCNECKHYDSEEYTCAAFPKEIPDAILGGEQPHNIPLSSQDNDIVFESI